MFGAINTDNSLQVGGSLEAFQQDGSGNLKVNVAAGGAGGGAVTVADGADVALGFTTDAAGANSVVGQLKEINISTEGTENNTANIPPPGQAAMAASTPVVIASNQSAVPVSGTVTTTPPSNASTNITQVGGSALSEGQNTMANSIPVVIASNQSTVPVSGGFTEQSGLSAGALNADLVPSFDVSSFKWFSLQITGTWTGTLTFQCSNDNSNFVSLLVVAVSSAGVVSTTSSNGIIMGPVVARFLRVRMTSYTSGTATGVLETYTLPAAFDVVTATQTGTWAVTANAGTNLNTSLLALESGGNLASLVSALDDGQETMANSLSVAIASDQSNVPISGTVTTTPPSNASTNLTQVGGAAIAEGQTTMANSLPVVVASDNGLIVGQGSTTSGQNGPLVQAAVTSASPSYTNGQTSPITQTPSGGVRVAQSGTWTVQPGNTPNSTPWLESINDGTNTANVLKSDQTAAGQNALLQAPTYFSTGTLTLNVGSPNTIWYDLGNYPWISLEILTNASAATLTFQTSGDASQTNIRTMGLLEAAQIAGGSAAGTSTSAVASFHGSRIGRYFRVSSNVSGANTITLVATFYTSVAAFITQQVALASQGSTGSAVPGTAMFQGVSDGTNLQGMRTPALFQTATATASGNTAVWTPQSGKKFRLMAYSIEMTANAAQSVSGLLEVTLQDATTAINMGMSAFVPSVAATVFGNNVTTGWRMLGNGKLSAAANNVLNVNLGAALSSGEVRVNAIGTEE